MLELRARRHAFQVENCNFMTSTYREKSEVEVRRNSAPIARKKCVGGLREPSNKNKIIFLIKSFYNEKKFILKVCNIIF